jgi:hypothetical protein
MRIPKTGPPRRRSRANIQLGGLHIPFGMWENATPDIFVRPAVNNQFVINTGTAKSRTNLSGLAAARRAFSKKLPPAIGTFSACRVSHKG